MRDARRTFSGTHNGGFTLMELVLVLGIIALTMMAAAPSLSAFARGRVPGNTAAQFVALTHYARSQAVSDGTTYRINIDAVKRQWWLTKDDGKNFVTIDDKFGQMFNLPNGIEMDCDAPADKGVQTLDFDPTGRCQPAVLHFHGAQPNDSVTVVCESSVDVFHIAGGT